MKNNLLTRTEFAKLVGVTGATITRHCQNTELGKACDGKMIDVMHPAAVEYVLQRNQKEKKPHVRGTAAALEKKIAEDSGDLIPLEIPENIIRFQNYTIRQIAQNYGNAPRFKDYLAALKSVYDLAEKEVKFAQMQGELVHRELVEQHIVNQFDSAITKLILDGSKTIATRLPAMAAAGATREELEKFVRDQIHSFIAPAKVKIERALKNV